MAVHVFPSDDTHSAVEPNRPATIVWSSIRTICTMAWKASLGFAPGRLSRVQALPSADHHSADRYCIVSPPVQPWPPFPVLTGTSPGRTKPPENEIGFRMVAPPARAAGGSAPTVQIRPSGDVRTCLLYTSPSPRDG